MRIVELGDYSMVIMKDSSDPYWISIGNIYRFAKDHNQGIEVGLLHEDGNYGEIACITSSDMVYTAGRLVLFFKDKIDPRYKLHSKVQLF